MSNINNPFDHTYKLLHHPIHLQKIIEDKKIAIDENGNFNIEYKVFDGPGGLSESSRLNVPLIGEIYLDPRLSKSIDQGTPFVFKHTNSKTAKEFEKIERKIKKHLNSND